MAATPKRTGRQQCRPGHADVSGLRGDVLRRVAGLLSGLPAGEQELAAARRAVPADRGDLDQYRDSSGERLDDAPGPPGDPGREPGGTRSRPGAHGTPRRDLPGGAGKRMDPPGALRVDPEERDLRGDLLPADRVPWAPRFGGCAVVGCGPVAGHARPVLAGAARRRP